MNYQILLFLPLLFLGGIVSTVSGGGLGILTVILGNLFLDIRTSIAFMSILMIAIQLAKIAHFHQHVLWRVVGWYILLGIPCSFLGGWLLYVVPEIIPRVGLGFMCIAFVIARFARITPNISATRSVLVVFGALNGFIGGLIGNASLVRMPALVSMGISKEVFVGTSAMIAFLMNLGKVSAYLPNVTWSRQFTLFFLASIPVLMLSVAIGKKFLRYVSVRLFEDLQLGIILIGAIRLIFFP